jgi:Lipin/Ned1/Smp2 multi-domain protein middle domain
LDPSEKTGEHQEGDEEEEKPVELSLCAHLINEKNEDDLTEIFNAHKVTYEKYCKDPFKILMNPHLLVKIEDHLYEWKIAAPLLISKLVFQQVIIYRLIIKILS